MGDHDSYSDRFGEENGILNLELGTYLGKEKHVQLVQRFDL